VDPAYLPELSRLAERRAPDRVTFHEPLRPEEVVPAIARFDMGFYLLEPSSFNNIEALPNKFFDFVVAGLAVCVGPSPAMAELVRRHGFGCVAPSFRAEQVAETLTALTPTAIAAMQRAAQRAAESLNAETEMGKLVALDQSIAPAETRPQRREM
jgi:hypothetical protein